MASSITNLGGDNVTYTTPGTAAVLDASANAVLSGITVADLKGGKIKVHFDSGGQAADTLGLNYGTSFAAGTVTLFMGLLYVNAFGAGAYSVGSASGGASGSDLTITFNNTSNVTLEAAQILLRSLTFKTTATGTPERSISVTVIDRNLVSSPAALVTVNQAVVEAAPTDIGLAPGQVAENTSTTSALDIGTLSSTDANTANTHTYSIVGGADSALFQLDTAGTGLQFKAGTVLDYETQSSYAVTVRSTDSANLSFDKTLTVTLTDVNDAPVLALNTGASLAAGATTTITGTALQASDVDTATSQVVFTVDARPAHGKLMLGQAMLGVGGTFTQADIDAGLLAYANTGGSGADSFAFTVDDGSGGTVARTSFNLDVAAAPVAIDPGPAPVGIVRTVDGTGSELRGTAYADTLTGLDGRDTFRPAGGNDKVDGGAGIDTVVFSGGRSQYQLAHGADGSFSVRAADGSTAVLSSVERLAFADQTLALDVTQMGATAHRMYLAALGRNADDEGLQYYTQAHASGATLLEAATGFVASAEFAQVYGDPTDAGFLAQIYGNALGRAPDAGGLAYYLDVLAQLPGAAGRALVLASFVESPEMQVKFAGVMDEGIPLLASA